MKFKYQCAIAIIAISGAVLPSQATTYLVDPGGGGFSTTIQPALTATSDGDTVLVTPAVYSGPGNVNLDFAGRNLLLLGLSGSDETIIKSYFLVRVDDAPEATCFSEGGK